MNVLGISSNTYNILATLFKHFFCPKSVHTHQGGFILTVAPWPGGPGAGVGKLSMLSEIVGKLSMLSEIVKDVDGGWGWGVAEDLKCCRPENVLVCRKSTALAPPNRVTGT